MSSAGSVLSAIDVIEALDLPPAALVNQRVAKKMLLQGMGGGGVPTTADRKLIQEYVDEMSWVAALKPVNSGVPQYQDEQHSYLEVIVMSVTLRAPAQAGGSSETKSAKVGRVAELLHRAIPYPLILLVQDADKLSMSLAHIRRAHNEADKIVLDSESVLVTFTPTAGHDQADNTTALAVRSDFLASLPLNKQPRANLRALYQGWMDALSALEAAAITGLYVRSDSPMQATERRAALRRYRELDAQIARLRALAGKDRQMAHQVAANLQIQALMAQRQQATSAL
ncbi:DUF4391 domain-containing protein [Variovorax sp. 770b2]|uniref:DUF4391 domain-containing protein n=1 Tax=Variovorax sp. 770b2 TaxID=1566271 RepID=UPI0008EA79CE|nr:DUF4391 domain-containing protein [Variovorax sp. 770b2]SFP14706.1 protein of unknown function [Variovorax sp. 770b2]